MSAFVVRAATVQDAAAIARLHVATWRETYAHLVPADQLEELATPARLERRTERWAEVLAERPDDIRTAWLGDVLIGFAGASSSDEVDRPRPVELETLYVLAAYHGSGAGQALLDAVLGEAPAFLSVAADNPRATRFYQRNRFMFDGVEEEHTLVRTPVRALRMVR